MISEEEYAERDSLSSTSDSGSSDDLESCSMERSLEGFAGKSRLLRMDVDDEFVFNSTESTEGLSSGTNRGIEVSMDDISNEKFLDYKFYMELMISRVKAEFSEGRELQEEEFIKACFFPVEFGGSQSWIKVMYKQVCSNADNGALKRFGIKNSHDINPTEFSTFISSYLRMSLTGQSVEEFYGLHDDGLDSEIADERLPHWYCGYRDSQKGPQFILSSALPPERFRGYLAGLKCSGDDAFPGELPQRCMLLQSAFSFCQTLRFHAKSSNYSFDDSKTVTSSKKVLQNTGSSSRIGKDRKTIYVDHQLSHASTGMCLGIARQGYGVAIKTSVRSLVEKLVRAVTKMYVGDLATSQYRDALAGCKLFVDRGYWTNEMINDLLDSGIGIHGTIKTTTGKFTAGTASPKKHQIKIDQGPLCCIWAVAPHQLRPVYYTAFRDGKSKTVALLVTSSPEYGPRKWVYDIACRAPSAGVEAPSADLFQSVRQITDAQGGREWFLSRILRLTSTTSNSILKLAAHDAEKGISECPDAVQNVLRALRYTPDLTFASHEPVHLSDDEYEDCLEVPQELVQELIDVEERIASHVSSRRTHTRPRRYWNDETVTANVMAMSAITQTSNETDPQERTRKRARASESTSASTSNAPDTRSVQAASGSSQPQDVPLPSRPLSKLNKPALLQLGANLGVLPDDPVHLKRKEIEALIRTRGQLYGKSTASPIISFFKCYTLHGTNATEKTFAMRKGALNEGVIYEKFSGFLLKYGKITVTWKHTVGLVAHKADPRLATSVDAVCLLQFPDGRCIPSLVEIKTRVSEKQLLRLERLKELATSVKTFSCLDDTFENVPPDNRQQLLHHAAVYDIEHVMFIESKMRKVHHAFIIAFPKEIRESYRNALLKTQMRYFSWLYGPLDDVPKVPAAGLQFGKDGIPERECILLHMEIFRFIESKSSSAVLPRCCGFRPATVSAWNKFKGGVDLSDQYASDFRFPAFLDGHQRLFLSCLEKACVNLYLLYSWHAVGKDADGNPKATSLKHLQELRRQNGITFKRKMMKLALQIEFILQQNQDIVAGGPSPGEVVRSSPPEQQISTPVRQPSQVGSSVSVEEYEQHVREWAKGSPSKVQYLRKWAMKHFNEEGSIPWKVRHCLSFDHCGVNYVDYMNYANSSSVPGRGTPDSQNFNTAKACVYCKAVGFRTSQGRSEYENNNSNVIDAKECVGRTTRSYCHSCHVFLCTKSYGLKVMDDGTTVPLPSFFELWHRHGKMQRPDDGYMGSAAQCSEPERSREGCQVIFGRKYHRFAIRTQRQCFALEQERNAMHSSGTYRNEFRPHNPARGQE